MTQKEAKQALCWFCRRAGLSNWTFRIALGKRPKGAPKQAVGFAASCSYLRSADIWVGVERCKKQGIDPVLVLFHELTHVAAGEAGANGSNARHERFFDDIAGFAAAAYRSRE